MPRLRTVTSGFNWLVRLSGHDGSQKLKNLAWYGQPFAQNRVPMQRL